MGLDSRCPHCDTGASLRVDVVWFGEMPFEMERIFAALEACDLFFSIGTSGSVYPAAGFIAEVRRSGRAHAVELNLEPSDGHSLFHETRYGPASQTVPAYVEELLSKR
jgi:NAD-dependent deacetylase